MEPIVVHKGRTVTVLLGLGFDVSDDTITSEIRAEKDSEADLIATWAVSFITDGVDGECKLVLDNSITQDIEESHGWMDIKRLSAGEPINVFDEPLEVFFNETITV